MRIAGMGGVGLMAVILLQGCSIKQNITPVTEMKSKQVCVIENPAVNREGFLEAYRTSLTQKGYGFKLLAADASTTACPVVSTYTANWQWDLALYMSYAEIKVYSNGKQAGEAVYDSRAGSGNMSKFIKGKEKVNELVNKLFP